MRYRQLVVLEVFVDDSAFDAGWPTDWPWRQMVRHHIEVNGHDPDECEVTARATTDAILDDGGAANDYGYKPDDWRYKHTEPEACPYYVNVYEVGQSYGGPEEGGWWFSTGDPLTEECLIFDTREGAEAGANLLREAFPSTGKQYSVNGGEDYAVMIEDRPARAWPTVRPHYE
jgi:hypothetical protein